MDTTTLFPDIKRVYQKHKIPSRVPTLYHYTSATSLISIIQNGQLWITHRDFMNDRKETTYADSILEESYSIHWDRPADGDFDTFRSDIFDQEKNDFVFSLSQKVDLANQWYSYGKNDGYCIEFSTNRLKKYFEHYKLEVMGGFVIYERAAQLAIYEVLFRYYNEFYRVAQDDPMDFQNQIYLDHVARYFRLFHLLSKQDNSMCEFEYRFVVMQDATKTTEFRNKDGLITPFIKVGDKTKKLPIEGIKIGPKINDHAALIGTKAIVSSAGYDPDSVTLSEMDVRS